jgi:Ni/Co efflux regulator RcnB
MKNLFILVSLGAFLAAAPVMAQNDDHNNRRQEEQKSQTTAPQHDRVQRGHEQRGANTASPAGRMSGPAQPTTGQTANRPAGRSNSANTNRSQSNTSHNGWSQHNRAVDNNRPRANTPYGRQTQNRAATDRSMQRGESRSRAGNFSHLRRNYTANRRYRFGRYNRPRGYYTHRWIYGQRMPSIFFARNYWITNFAAFGLMLPPPGTVWVRYGNDAVLIDRYTGEVIQVVYDIFY